jgi:CRP/FNR family transcriptional regulator
VNKESILLQTQLFENISSKHLSVLAGICLPKKFLKKEILFREGEKGYSLYILVSGHVQLYKSTAGGKEIVIKVVEPGELFAEAILFEENRYPVTALALEPCLVFLLPKHQFNCLLENEAFRGDFIGGLIKKLRYLAGQISSLSAVDVEERLRLFLRNHYGRKEKITCRLAKKSVAAAIGTTPETLSRLLLRLKNERKLLWEGESLTVYPGFWE